MVRRFIDLGGPQSEEAIASLEQSLARRRVRAGQEPSERTGSDTPNGNRHQNMVFSLAPGVAHSNKEGILQALQYLAAELDRLEERLGPVVVGRDDEETEGDQPL